MPAAVASASSVESAPEMHIDDYPLTEGGNASRLSMLHYGDMIYCHTSGKWFIWTGTHWRMDDDGQAIRYAEDVIKYLYLKAQNASSAGERSALFWAAMYADRSAGLKNILEIAKSREEFAITAAALDADPWRLCTGDYTIELKSVTARESRQSDYITKEFGTMYDPTAQCPRWKEFLGKIFVKKDDNGNFVKDEELIKYIQKAVGYSLTGSVREECFFILWGEGANGKSVFLLVLGKLFGDYAKGTAFETFLEQPKGKVRNDLAALAGARFVSAIESKNGDEFSEATIKMASGKDSVTSRFLFHEEFTYNPQYKLWLATNHKPVIKDLTYSIWRRVHLVPFDRIFEDAEQDKDLEAKLIEELPGILNWALDGLREYIEEGFKLPKAIKDASEAYRQESDSIGAFISECCVLNKDDKTTTTWRSLELNSAYQRFCAEEGRAAFSPKEISKELIKRGCTKKRDSRGMVWHGIMRRSDNT
jgi:putative DNA primase/helicase